MGKVGEFTGRTRQQSLQGDEPEEDALETKWPVLICLLGTFRILKAGRPFSLRGGGKAEALLLNLSINTRNCTSRAFLLRALWPDRSDKLAGQSLNTLVYALHKALGDALGGAAPVQHADGHYRLNSESGVGVDVACFESLVKNGEERARSGHLDAAAVVYNQAAALYQGDLCGGDDVRATMERERLRMLYLTLLARLAEFHYSRRDCEACLQAALELLRKDPCREDAHRMVMRCYVRRGERTQALRQYRLCEAILRAEFDVTPERPTTALFDQVRLDPESV